MLVDAHAHIDRYTVSLNEALNRIEKHRILTMAVAMDVPSYLKTLEIAHSSPYIIPAFGIHPWEALRYKDALDELDCYLEQTPVIGEAGLDFHFVEDKDLYAGQMKVFEYQCAWSQRLSKPMNLHTKGAERFKIGKPLIHWYSGPINHIDSYLEIGSYFTVGVEVLTSKTIQSIVDTLPMERILLETDNPGGYKWLTNEEGMPELLLKVLERVAESKRMTATELESRLEQNWKDFIKGNQALEHWLNTHDTHRH